MECSIVAPCHFGLEAVLKREIADLGLGITEVEDGRVIFKGGLKDIARANICLRTAERILIECGRFTATTYDELFEGIKNIPWEEYIPKDADSSNTFHTLTQGYRHSRSHPFPLFLLKT